MFDTELHEGLISTSKGPRNKGKILTSSSKFRNRKSRSQKGRGKWENSLPRLVLRKKNYLGLGFDLFLASFPLKSSGFIVNFKLFCYPSLNPRVYPRLKVRLASQLILCNRQCYFFNIWTLTSGAKLAYVTSGQK